MKTAFKMTWDGKTLGGNENLTRLIAETPFERGFGWVIESDGEGFVCTGQRKVALRPNGKGQLYACGARNAACQLTSGVNADGDTVDFVLASVASVPGFTVEEYSPAKPEARNFESAIPAPVVREPEKPRVKVRPVAPRRLETMEDAEFYQVECNRPIPANAIYHCPLAKMTFPASKRSVPYRAEQMGLGPDGARAFHHLNKVSAAMISGDPEAVARALKDYPCPVDIIWPGDPGSPEFEAWEV